MMQVLLASVQLSYTKVSFINFPIAAKLHPGCIIMIEEVTRVQLAYFLKSVLNSPKAAPVLEVVGVLSCPASTAASAPPWSLYKAPVDMLCV